MCGLDGYVDVFCSGRLNGGNLFLGTAVTFMSS